jgi:hypothetical protein
MRTSTSGPESVRATVTLSAATYTKNAVTDLGATTIRGVKKGNVQLFVTLSAVPAAAGPALLPLVVTAVATADDTVHVYVVNASASDAVVATDVTVYVDALPINP